MSRAFQPVGSARLRWESETRDMEESRSPGAGLTRELALLLLLATLWGASYSFIKLGVATIAPITLIAWRTLIAGVLLLLVMRWRGVTMPTDAATWRRFAVQACLNSVIPWTLIAWGERSVDAGLATILNSAAPIFTFLFTALVTRHETTTPRKLLRRHGGHGRDLPDRRRQGARSGGARSFGRKSRSSRPRSATLAARFSAAGSRAWIRWRPPQARCCAARRC